MRPLRLSDYPLPKIYLRCPDCGIEAQYDRDDLIRAGGDRDLTDFGYEAARRKGCTKPVSNPIYIYDRCGIAYPDLAKVR